MKTVTIQKGRATFTWAIPESLLSSNQDTEALLERLQARLELAINNGWTGPIYTVVLDQMTWEKKGRQKINSYYGGQE